MSKQTAVEFLVKKFNENVQFFDIDENHLILLLQAIKQAKEMEKEQIMDAHINGMDSIPVYPNYNGDAEQYYNETYKNK